MRRALLAVVAGIATAAASLAIIAALILLAGHDAYQAATVPTPTPNQEPRP